MQRPGPESWEGHTVGGTYTFQPEGSQWCRSPTAPPCSHSSTVLHLVEQTGEVPSLSCTSHLQCSAGHGDEFQKVLQMPAAEIMSSFHKQGTALEKVTRASLSHLTEPG